MNDSTSARFWDRAAEKYAASPIADMDAYEATLDRVRAYLTPDSEALELGCGTGTTALKLAGSVRSILATDISGEMIRIARGKAEADGAETVEFQVARLGDPALEARPFDVVMAFNLLHLLPDLPDALERMKASLKPGGLLISKTPCLKRRAWLIRPMIALRKLVGNAPSHVALISAGVLDDQVAGAGFEIVETGNYPDGTIPSRFIVARRADTQ